MKNHFYSVYDKKGKFYHVPWSQPSDGQAFRLFQELVNDSKTSFSRHPEDHTLCRMGEMDMRTGLIIPEPNGPQHLMAALDVLDPVTKTPNQQDMFNSRPQAVS